VAVEGLPGPHDRQCMYLNSFAPHDVLVGRRASVQGKRARPEDFVSVWTLVHSSAADTDNMPGGGSVGPWLVCACQWLSGAKRVGLALLSLARPCVLLFLVTNVSLTNMVSLSPPFVQLEVTACDGPRVWFGTVVARDKPDSLVRLGNLVGGCAVAQCSHTFTRTWCVCMPSTHVPCPPLVGSALSS